MDGEGEYGSNDAYQSKEFFFKKYFKYRYIDWDNFLQRNCHKDDEVLSIASGRCINELRLLNEGYSISCSDLGIPPHYDASVQLFGPFPFFVLDICCKSPDKEYDSIFCLSTLHYFNNDNLDKFFHNVNKGLKQDKYLYVDPGGASDNILTYFWDVWYLAIEHNIVSFIYKLIKKPGKVLVKHDHGFRNTNEEIIESARKSGFEFVSLEEFAFLDEFRRSLLLRAIIARSSLVERILSILGRRIPLIRMLKFKKTSNTSHQL